MAIEIVDNNFLSRVFSYFGMTASSFMFVSGIFLSQTGLDDIINPAIWVVASAFSLIFAYSVRRYVPSKFLLFLVSVVFVAICSVYIYREFGEDLYEWLAPSFDPKIMSLAASFGSLFLPLSMFSLLLVSHQKHEFEIRDNLPPLISVAVRSQVYENPIYYKTFEVESSIEWVEESVSHSVRVDVAVKMIVVNRTSRTIDMPHRYSRSTGNFRLNRLVVDGKPKDIEDPSLYSGDGFRSVDFLAPKSEIDIYASLTEYFSHDDAQLYSCFDCPAERFVLMASNLSPEKLLLSIEKNNLDSSVYERSGNVLTWESSGALLPHQGARIVWTIKENKK